MEKWMSVIKQSSCETNIYNLQLQKTVQDFDGKTLTIKAWSVTFGLATIASAFISHRRDCLDGRRRMTPEKCFTSGSKNTHRNGPRIASPHIFHVAFDTFVGI
jgi:hypothetical protein